MRTGVDSGFGRLIIGEQCFFKGLAMYLALKKESYEAFLRGEKSIEWRAAGGIYERLRADDVIKLGLGYTGRHHLMRVWYVRKMLREDAPVAARDIYPDAAEFLAIHCRPIAMDVSRSAAGPA